MTSIFVNIPTNDLDRSIAFYRALGCAINPNFTDENAACVVWSDDIFFMVLRREFFATFTDKPLGEPKEWAQVSLSFARDSRADVDAIVEAGWLPVAPSRTPLRTTASCTAATWTTPTATASASSTWTPSRPSRVLRRRPRDARRARSPDHRAVVVIGAVEVEVDDDGDVIARDLTLALVAVDGGRGHRVGEGVRAEDEVDAQALVAGKRNCL
jgi:predicted enzyme related to lactoylglutathione lyase